jgi:hypothetical protein
VHYLEKLEEELPEVGGGPLPGFPLGSRYAAAARWQPGRSPLLLLLLPLQLQRVLEADKGRRTEGMGGLLTGGGGAGGGRGEVRQEGGGGGGQVGEEGGGGEQGRSSVAKDGLHLFRH